VLVIKAVKERKLLPSVRCIRGGIDVQNNSLGIGGKLVHVRWLEPITQGILRAPIDRIFEAGQGRL